MTTPNEAREATRSAEIAAKAIAEHSRKLPSAPLSEEWIRLVIADAQRSAKPAATPDEGATRRVDDMTQTVFTDAGTIDAVPKDFARQLERELNAAQQEAARLRAVVAELQTGHDRYEFVRKLRPVQFATLFQNNITTGIHFDDLVDAARAGERARDGLKS